MSSTAVIIFGGSSGIGEATAKKLTLNDFRVIIVGRDRNRLEAARTRIGANVEIASVDATNRTAVNDFFEHIGCFQHLVLSFSEGKGAGPFTNLDFDDVRSGMEGKFFAQISVAQSALTNIQVGGSMSRSS